MSDLKIDLTDKYHITSGRIFINGNQALVRLPVLQRELDMKAGLNTAGFISGYRGSPLGGYDSNLWQSRDLLSQHQITFQPGVNEDLAATAIWGTQQLNLLPEPTVDGVFSIWYGKGPGVDRSGDPFKHGNYAGTHQNGGVLVVYGDDHPGKSSTVAHQSEHALAANNIPSLYPADVGEFFDFGLLGWALSRYSGLWIGFKCVNETVEQTATIDIDIDKFQVNLPDKNDIPDGVVNLHNGKFAPPQINETNVIRYRIPLVHRFVRANGIDRAAIPVNSDTHQRRVGIVTAGKAYNDVMEALRLLDIDAERAEQLGLSVYKVGCIWPLEPEGFKTFACGQDELLFLEEKRAMLEDQASTILINDPERPRCIGKLDETGAPLIDTDIQLEPARLALVIADRLAFANSSYERLKQQASSLEPRAHYTPVQPPALRPPFFCSGCPHNTSTCVPEGSIAMGGIGCHGMAAMFRDDTLVPTQMGGEGIHWTGLSRYTRTKHVFQNLGDGTYFHSGLMAIRAAVAAKSNITYKILYNDAVAMTGGQPIDGPISVGSMMHQVIHEGVKKCVLVTDQPAAYDRNANLPSDVEIYHRDRLEKVQQDLRDTEGCTVLIYEQTCAAEKRRRRKRSQMPDPAKRFYINDAVCEGCGDCSLQSTCVSIQPVDTPLGTKRRIDQSSCNKDYSCNKGFCPSFISIVGGKPRKPEGAALSADLFEQLPAPEIARLDQNYGVMITGIGGSGVITVGAILGMAAHIDGKACSIYDMTGLSQKNGAVYSHLKFAPEPSKLNAQRLGVGDANLLLAFDLLAALAPESSQTLSHGQTHIIGNSDVTPTAAFQLGGIAPPETALLQQKLNELASDNHSEYVDATGLALSLLGDTIATNMFVVGYALQKGLLPVSVDAIVEAVKLNGVAVPFNLQALNLGRLYAYKPALVENLKTAPQVIQLPETLADLRSTGIKQLTAYQNSTYAADYAALVDRVAETESQVNPGSDRLAKAVAKSLAKLMSYKDEYEVARLHSDPEVLDRIKSEFEGDYQLKFNLAPPLLSKRHPDTGLPVKREFGGWMLSAFRLLAKLKPLRGTPLDIFGYNAERKQERQLIQDYRTLVSQLLEGLTEANLDTAVKLAELPLEIRGFGHVKARNLESVRQQEQLLLKEFTDGPQLVQVITPNVAA